MKSVLVHVRAVNQLTGEVVIDNNPGIEIPDYKYETALANANAFADMLRDCQISITASNGDSVSIPARNMMMDRENMPWEEFMDKWYYPFYSAPSEPETEVTEK